jgi:pimeloyl-ACP methyl ester carboxylesterase
VCSVWRMVDRDFGGVGPPVALLHGLAGYAGEWAETASWLTENHHVLALEQRGHGRDGRTTTDVSRAAFVADAEKWLDRFEPAVVVGHSLGGHTAFLVAAERPDLVRALVVLEATPAADPEAPAIVRGWLESWPVPFPDREHAQQFFGGDTTWSQAWGGGLEQRDDGLWPAFDIDLMVAALEEVSRTSYWDAWTAVRCPILIVRAAAGDGWAEYQRMVELQPDAQLVEILDAGHDVHLDQPQRWREALERFLNQLPLDR